LRDAIVQVEGRTRSAFGYELQMDFADLMQNQGVITDFENPGLMDAFMFKQFHNVEIKAGYMKVPYSWQSLVPFFRSPFWQRAEISRGDFFSRRDVGVLLHTELLHNLIYGEGIFKLAGSLPLPVFRFGACACSCFGPWLEWALHKTRLASRRSFSSRYQWCFRIKDDRWHKSLFFC
jgi:hypothetical protein